MIDFQTADLYDQYEDALQVAAPIFQNYGKKHCFGGEMVTIKCFEDNSFVREVLGTDGKGKVLVVDGGGSLRCALVGDLLAQKGIDSGWEGIIVYGCIRDSRVINQMEIGIKALNTNPKKSVKRNEGLKEITVHFANVSFKSGEYVYADEDGIVVSQTKLI
jgi:regulator of ribonuclease activity A